MAFAGGTHFITGTDAGETPTGTAGNDAIYALGGGDRVDAGGGHDYVFGGGGSDTIDGGKGDDVVSGGAGDDHLYGDLGADRLTGGAGADVFHFSGNDAAVISTDTPTGHVDTITDLAIGQDHIALGFTPADVIHGAAQDSLASALSYATGLLQGHSGTVVAVDVGNDTVLFYGSGGGPVVDSAIDLQNVHAASVGSGLFV